MNKQEMFDKVVRHLIRQNKKSIDSTKNILTNSCMYRFGELQCAIGCLIEDDEYDEKMENLLIRNLIFRFKDKFSTEKFNLFEENLRLLITLQTIHDHEKIENWSQKLKQLAVKNNLNYPIICEECAT